MESYDVKYNYICMEGLTLNLQHVVNRAHQRSEIASIIPNPHSPHEFISIAHDGFIRAWNSRDLSMTRQSRIRTPYLICITAYKDGFLLGVGNGSLLKITSELQVESIFRLHQDCLTSITVTTDSVVTVGHDGRICFLNIDSLALESCLEVESPLTQCVLHDDFLFIAGNPSYKVSLKTKAI